MKYSIRMRFRDGRGYAYLICNGRDRWSKRVAQRHMHDVSTDSQWCKHYDEFILEEA